MKNLFATAVMTAVMLFTAATQAMAVPVFQMRVMPTGGSCPTYPLTYNGTINPGNMSGAVTTGLAPINFVGSPGSNFTAGFLGVPGIRCRFRVE